MNALKSKTGVNVRSRKSLEGIRTRPVQAVLIAVSLNFVMLQAAMAGLVPDKAVTDADKGYFRQALVQIQPLLADHANDPDVQFRYGQALMGIGKAGDAITALNTAVSLDPKNGLYHRVLGEAYGLKAQQQFVTKPGFGSVFGMIGVMKSARREFISAVQLAPEDVQSHVDLAMFYIMVPGIMGGSYSGAHVEEAVIDKLDPVQGLQVHANEAGNRGDVAAGEALLKQAIAQDKTSGSLIALGLFYADAKRYDDAFKAFEDAETKYPNGYIIWYQIGKTAGLARTNYDTGIASLKQYLAFDNKPDTVPSNAWAHFRLGNLYEYQGHIDLAKTEYQAAASTNSDADPVLIAKLDKAEAGLK